MRELNQRYMDLLDETHQQNVFVQSDGRKMCRQCHDTWPCDTRLLVDAFKQMGALLNTVGALNMQAFGLVAELRERVAQDYAEYVGDNEARKIESIDELLARSEAYLEIGMPK